MCKLYMEVTKDQYALPVRVCDNIRELSKLTGLTINNLYCQIGRGKRGVYKYPKFIVVEVEDD